MKTKAQVEIEALAKDADGYKARLEAAELKVKAMEAEKVAAITGGQRSHIVSGSRQDSDEQKALRYFGCASPAKLIKVNTADPRFKAVPDHLKGLVLSLKNDVDTARFIAQRFHGGPQDIIGSSNEANDRIAHVKSIGESYFAKDVVMPRLKAFGSTVTNGGDEWVPTMISNTFVPEYELEFLLESRFREINMPSNTYELPVTKGLTKARKATENTAMTDASFLTDKIAFSATKSAEYYILPEELTEDSAPDFMAVGRDEVVRAQFRAWESAIINGDNDGTHIDTDTQAAGADVAEKFCKGLRRQALANSANGSTTDFSNAAVTSANLRVLRQRMKKFGVNPSELIMICGPAVYQQLVSLTDVATVEKFGPMATILRGALAAYQGIPITISQFMREDLNATGVYDSVTTNRGGLLLVHWPRWFIGMRRPIVVKVMQDLPSQDRWLMASYQRKDFQGHVQSATELSVGYGFNIAL